MPDFLFLVKYRSTIRSAFLQVFSPAGWDCFWNLQLISGLKDLRFNISLMVECWLVHDHLQLDIFTDHNLLTIGSVVPEFLAHTNRKMTWTPIASSPFQDPNVRFVLAGMVFIASSTIGTFAFLRKDLFTGDAVAHSVLPGVCLAFLIFQTRNLWVLLGGAFVTGWLSILFVDLITSKSRIKPDAAIGIALSFSLPSALCCSPYPADRITRAERTQQFSAGESCCHGTGRHSHHESGIHRHRAQLLCSFNHSAYSHSTRILPKQPACLFDSMRPCSPR